jgi:ribosomal protein L32
MGSGLVIGSPERQATRRDVVRFGARSIRIRMKRTRTELGRLGNREQGTGESALAHRVTNKGYVLGINGV